MENKKILLVHYSGKENPFLPLGALYVAGSLRDAGFTPKLIPSNIPHEKYRSILKEEKPLYVGFSVYTFPQISEMIHLSKSTKKMGYPTVWGGYHPTVLPEQCIAEPYIDYVLCGEGEEISVKFSKELSNGNLGNKKIFKALRIINDLDNFKPAFDLVNLNNYIFPVQDHLISRYNSLKRFGYLLTSRGCSSNCKFCGVHGIYNEQGKSLWNTHSFDYIKDEINVIKSYIKNLESIIIWDDNFFKGNSFDERSIKILEHLKNQDIKFNLEVRGTFLKRKENVSLLKDLGCLQVFIGAESGSQKVLDLMRKGTNISDYLIASENCIEKGLPLRMSFFYGYPGETIADIHKTQNFIKQVKELGPEISISGPKMYRPVPGTEGFKDAINLGFIPPKKTSDWALINSNLNPSILPWLVNETKKLGILDSEISSWLKIRENN